VYEKICNALGKPICHKSYSVLWHSNAMWLPTCKDCLLSNVE